VTYPEQDSPSFRQLLKSGLAVAVNPGGALKTQLQSYPASWAMAVSGSAFLLIFLQSGLDLHRTGQAEAVQALGWGLVGLGFGTVGVGLLATIAWLLAHPFGRNKPWGWALRAFSLAYSPALIYGILGLAANLVLGWNTAVAFGVTGFIWAIGPMLTAAQEMTEDHTGASYLIGTTCGSLMLVGWGVMVS
jgi:hypothetical protein